LDSPIAIDAEGKEIVSGVDVDAVYTQDVVVLWVLENQGVEETALLEAEAIYFVA